MRPRAAALKALLDEPRLQIMPGYGDGMGAHLIEEPGFRTGFISGSSISATRLAMPDMDLVSFGEMADAVETGIAAAPNVLWLSDGDTGHGNAGGAAASVPAPQAVRDRDTLRCGVAFQLLVRRSYFDRGRALAVFPRCAMVNGHH
jgi:2-methylisocitrate lyase-like PEP mutase family enzyme